MSDMGWIKVHRKLLENSIFINEKGLKVWIWCLLRANHQEADVYIGRQKVHLGAGQFVTGRNTASKELKMGIGTVYFWFSRLTSERYIERKPTNKYTIVSIVNWNKYQQVERKSNNRRNADGTQIEQQMEPDNNDNKNVKNVKKDNTIVLSDAKLRHKQDIDLILKTLREKLNLPRLDLSERVNRQYAWNLLRRSKKGVEGVLWLIDLAAEDDWFRHRITSTRDLWSNQIKLVAKKRGDTSERVAVL